MGHDFEKEDKIAVAGATVDSTGVIETHVTICTVVEVGHADLLVKLDRVSSSTKIVPKSICTPIKFDASALAKKILEPLLGDMILYSGKLNWRDKEESIVIGTVYEIKYREGMATTVRVHTGTDMVDLPYGEVMVLQRKPISSS